MSNVCQICKTSFTFQSLLIRHQRGKNKCKEDVVKRLDCIVPNEDMYKCRFCYKEFSEQRNLTKHIQKKRCKGKNDNVQIYERELHIEISEGNSLTCRFCNIEFTKQCSDSRHMNSYCKSKIAYEYELEKRVLENRKQLAASISINGNDNNNTVNNNNNIFLPPMNAFGNENLDYITTKMLLKQIDLTDIPETVKMFTQLIHAHPAHPENHNVLFKDTKTPLTKTFNGTNFDQ